MEKATITKIRPVSWKIVTQGLEQAQYVRQALSNLQVQTTECVPEPTLVEPPLYAFIATPAADSPMTADELQAALEDDERVEVAVDNP